VNTAPETISGVHNTSLNSQIGTNLEIHAKTSPRAIVIHGFWTELKSGPNGSYTKIVVPGMGAVQQRGAPSLPALRVDLAVPGGDAAVKIRAAEASETITYNDVMIWPNPVPETDQEGGRPEQFVIDEKIYSQRTAFPGSAAEPLGPVAVKLGSIHGVTLERAIPSSGHSGFRITLKSAEARGAI
jgi:hypothetical protein